MADVFAGVPQDWGADLKQAHEVKDVTSILSMNRDMRTQVLGALREVHDGSWVRKVGTDGGQSLPWVWTDSDHRRRHDGLGHTPRSRRRNG
jgi:hypothetical protein